MRLILIAKAKRLPRISSGSLKDVVKKGNIHRVTFNEITPKAVIAAFDKARDVDQNLVDAQQTRRVLDRIVGYQISPLLWDKVRRGLSAGRVQTVALRLIVEREREIKAFVPVEYWTIDANLGRQNAECGGVQGALHRHQRHQGRGADRQRAQPAG